MAKLHAMMPYGILFHFVRSSTMLAYFILLLLLQLISSYTVVPDDYHLNVTCQDCHNLQWYLQNSTKYFTHNTQLLFLPGQHCLHTDLVIENVHNISLIGRSNEYSNTTNIIIQCNSSVGIIMKNVTNISVENMVIKNCLPNSFSAAVTIKECSSVKLNHIQIFHTHQWSQKGICLKGYNVMGKSYFNYISCDKQINFDYYETNSSFHDQMIFLDHYNILSNFTDRCAIYVGLNQFSYTLTVHILNTNPKQIHKRFLEVQSKSLSKSNTMVITNCRFIDNQDPHLLCLVGVNAYFNRCQFENNDCKMLISVSKSEILVFSYCTFHHNKMIYSLIATVYHFSNIKTEHCNFYENSASILVHMDKRNPKEKIYYINCTQIVTVIIKNTTFNKNNFLRTSFMTIGCARLLLIGPVKFHNIIDLTTNTSSDHIHKFFSTISSTTIQVVKSTVIIYGYIEFSQNKVATLITYDQCESQECFTMNVADNATLMIINNSLGTYFISLWDLRYYHTRKVNYPPCFFQYLHSSTTNYKIGHTNYSIIFNRNAVNNYGYLKLFSIKLLYSHRDYEMLQQVRLLVTHCYWLPHSAFAITMPLAYDVNEKYIDFANNSEDLPQMSTPKLLCYCTNDTHYDCYKDDLGYLYPGQTANVPFCYQDNLMNTSNAKIVVDTNFNGTHFTPCIVHKPEELIQFTSKKCISLQYTIAFFTESWCELFLKAPFHGQMEYSVFYIRQLLCPLGFIKKDGICQCYPLFKPFDITDCNINNQTILRPANSWISAANHNNYYISLYCPFYYCMQYPSYLNLATPHLQCQFNRSGLLCGQCQQGFSTVFGSPDCQHCSSVYLLLIIPIAIAGMMLVLLLFILNLTVTDGTINAFILYANIISINSTTFFPDYNSSQNTFEYVFISLANLDLGIKTCFYNGMDDYAKMWLQLAFPFYLIFIAVLLILASRYSTTIQKITAHRALPVLATLFLLSYTKILRTVSIVLFFYSSITNLPSEHSTVVWSVDANVSLFGVQFVFLFVVCLILFLALVPFNVILLFTKIVSRFSIVTKFKPLLDAYQGPYKIKFYYWTGLQLMLRTLFFGLSSLDSNMNLTIGIIILFIVNIAHAYNKPFKSMVRNYQESLYIINLLGLYAFTLSFSQNDISKASVNVLITMALAQLVLIISYHILKYAFKRELKERAMSMLHASYNVLTNWITRFHNKPKVRRCDQQFHLHSCTIPERTYNYHEYQEPLIGQEYCK